MELISGKQGFELVSKNGNWILKEAIGFSPVEMLVASVGACGAYVYEKILTNSAITYQVENVLIDYERAEDKQAKPVSKISISFVLSNVSQNEQDKAERAMHLIEKNCPVIQSLDSSIEVTEAVRFI